MEHVGTSLEEMQKLADIRFRNAEAALKEAEASRLKTQSDNETLKLELEIQANSIKEQESVRDNLYSLGKLLLDSKPNMFGDTPGVPMFEDEEERNIIRQKILSIVKRL